MGTALQYQYHKGSALLNLGRWSEDGWEVGWGRDLHRLKNKEYGARRSLQEGVALNSTQLGHINIQLEVRMSDCLLQVAHRLPPLLRHQKCARFLKPFKHLQNISDGV